MKTNLLILSTIISSLILTGCGKSEQSPETKSSGGKQLTVAVMPKSKGNPYFVSCKKGADDAARELKRQIALDGPTDPDPASKTRSSRPG